MSHLEKGSARLFLLLWTFFFWKNKISETQSGLVSPSALVL